MHRSKKILILTHCILNVNAKVYGLANYEGTFNKLVEPIINGGFGLLQLPCPEMITCGARRWGQVKDQYETTFFKQEYKKILMPIINQLLDYKNNNYTISGVIGIDGSPSCGVNKTCRGDWGGEIDNSFNLEEKLNSLKEVSEPGVFMEVFISLLEENNLELPFFALDEENPAASVQYILKELI
ncbi:MAG: CD3072 family TudS-related putative desulfidase [Halarcobacter sp.]